MRQKLRRIALDAGMHAVAGMAEWLPRMRQRQNTFNLIEDVEYTRHGGEALCLDVLQPKGAGPHPVLIYLHGGAFAIGSKRTHRGLAAAYAAQGYLVCNVDYRLAPKHPFPAALEDACAAWLWAADHVAQYGGDVQHMALGGESAGANLALAVTLACCTARPEPYAAPLLARGLRPSAALLYCGFLQTSRPERYIRAGVSALAAQVATDAARSYLGPAAQHPGPEHALADPLCVIETMAQAPSLPPLFIAAGLADPVAADSQRLEQALLRLQSPHHAYYYPGETHAFHVMFWREQAIKCWHDSFGFLQQYLPTRK
jgi:acetyl esterase